MSVDIQTRRQVKMRSYQEKPHTVADETSYENPVKHDIIDGDGDHKRSDERPKTTFNAFREGGGGQLEDRS